MSAMIYSAFAIFFLQTQFSMAAPLKVGVVLDRGGKDDHSFNSSANQGALRAAKELGVVVKVVETANDNEFDSVLKSLATRGYDLIISIGFSQNEAIKRASAAFPQRKFAIVDSKVDAPNVRSLLFEEHEGSFLVGAAAALSSKTGKIGFVGGMDIPMIRRFQLGYEAGAKHVRPNTQVFSTYIGLTSEAWNNPPRAKELARAQYAQGADVIFGVAGASNIGVLDAAEETKKLAIGVDSNQNGIKPGFVLTSMLKRIDEAVFQTILDMGRGQFTGGVARLGLKNRGVDYALDANNSKLMTAEILATLTKLKTQIVTQSLKVPDYYTQHGVGR